MQKLDVEIIKTARKGKMEKLEKEMKEVLSSHKAGEVFICPYCKYESKKNKKGSAVIFDNGESKSFKCFSCSKWRMF